jgi:hypothetical protein
MEAPLIFPVLPDGHGRHIRYSFGLAQHAADQGVLHG